MSGFVITKWSAINVELGSTTNSTKVMRHVTLSIMMPYVNYAGNAEEVKQQYTADLKKHLTKLLDYL